MDLSRYNKLIAGVVGSVVGFVLVWLAAKTPLAQCEMLGRRQVCTMFGMSQAELTGIVMFLITNLAVYISPKNSMTTSEAVIEVATKNRDIKIALPNTVEGRAINAVTPDNVQITASPSVM